MGSERLQALKKGGWLEFAGNQQPKCPHCGSEFHIGENDAWHLYSSEDTTHTVECPSCECEFDVVSSAIWLFSTDEQPDYD